MQLTFEHIQNIGAGQQPQAIHTPENIVQVLYVSNDPTQQGRIYAMDASTPYGAWANREFNPAYLVCTDVDVEHMKLKYVSASSIFVVWKNETEEGETGTVRHRLAVWAMRQDLSKYLVDGDLEFRLDDPVAKISVELENPSQIVSDENDTILTPGTSLTLFFRSGDSARYIMGRYFVDRNDMGATDSTTRTDGRNGIGKLLKDQTFDEDNVFTARNLQQLGIDILESFGVDNYWVGTTTAERGMEFPPDMNGLEGFQELLKTITSWRLKEELTGQIGFGHNSDSRFTQPSTYTFRRDRDVFSRNVVREDMEAYSRVCVHNDDYSIKVYRDVNFQFSMPRKKTLYIPVAEGTSLADTESYADEAASLLASVGVIETFVGPFRPQLIPGDQARITAPGSKLLGLITTVRHEFGKSGYYTEFVVDSGGRISKPRFADYIAKVSGRQKELSSSVKRLY